MSDAEIEAYWHFLQCSSSSKVQENRSWRDLKERDLIGGDLKERDLKDGSVLIISRESTYPPLKRGSDKSVGSLTTSASSRFDDQDCGSFHDAYSGVNSQAKEAYNNGVQEWRSQSDYNVAPCYGGHFPKKVGTKVDYSRFNANNGSFPIGEVYPEVDETSLQNHAQRKRKPKKKGGVAHVPPPGLTAPPGLSPPGADVSHMRSDRHSLSSAVEMCAARARGPSKPSKKQQFGAPCWTKANNWRVPQESLPRQYYDVHYNQSYGQSYDQSYGQRYDQSYGQSYDQSYYYYEPKHTEIDSVTLPTLRNREKMQQLAVIEDVLNSKDDPVKTEQKRKLIKALATVDTDLVCELLLRLEAASVRENKNLMAV